MSSGSRRETRYRTVRCHDVTVSARQRKDRFVGPVPQLKSGIWIGIEYDEPVGKNDGSVEGTSYFTCPPGHGAFVRPTKVRVGDYPPFDDFADEI